MKNIVEILRHVVTPLILCLFLILGVTAAALSGLVEYTVINEMFSANGYENYNFYIPLVMVVVLEGLKLFLHYVIPAHKQAKDVGKHIIIKEITKYTLVLFSLLCTVIYVSNSLYDPNALVEANSATVQAIQEKYQEQLSEQISRVEMEISDRLSSEKDKVEGIREQLAQLTPVYRPTRAYENYMQEKQRLEDNLTTAQKAYDLLLEELNNEKSNKISQLEMNIKNEIQKEIADNSEDFSYTSAGDNKYLSSALEFFMSIFGNGEYDRRLYFFCVLTISLVISVVLELAISFAQGYLALNTDVLQKLFGTDKPIAEEIKERANRTIKIIVQASIMLAICLICLTVSKTIVDSQGILSAFASYFISIVLTSERFSLALNVGEVKEDRSTIQKCFVKTKNYSLPVLVQTLICVVGFLLISIYCGYSLSDLVPSTIALSIGSISGQVILRPKGS